MPIFSKIVDLEKCNATKITWGGGEVFDKKYCSNIFSVINAFTNYKGSSLVQVGSIWRQQIKCYSKHFFVIR